MLLECVKSQDCTSNESGTQANEDEWKAKSKELLEWEGKYKIVCEKIFIPQKLWKNLMKLQSCLAVPVKTEVKIVGVGQFIA